MERSPPQKSIQSYGHNTPGLRALKENPVTAGIPVIAVTVAAQPEEIRTAEKSGFAAFLKKPLEIPLLMELLDQFLG
ncbi:MAG: response regulator [Spirochaetaceae bacterium]|nr:MAG: response regulator [Spirochaetaceae bacterium]